MHFVARSNPVQIGQGLLTYGASMRPLTAAAAAWGVARGLRVLVVDAANRFDPYRLAQEGRKRGLPPDQVLSRVWVARAFTCHQLVQLVQEGLPAELAGGEWALVLLLGPCSLFYDEQVPLPERRRLFRTMMGALAPIKVRAALWFLQPNLPPQVANQHFGRLLARLADQVIQVGAGEGGRQEKTFTPQQTRNVTRQLYSVPDRSIKRPADSSAHNNFIIQHRTSA